MPKSNKQLGCCCGVLLSPLTFSHLTSQSHSTVITHNKLSIGGKASVLLLFLSKCQKGYVGERGRESTGAGAKGWVVWSSPKQNKGKVLLVLVLALRPKPLAGPVEQAVQLQGCPQSEAESVRLVMERRAYPSLGVWGLRCFASGGITQVSWNLTNSTLGPHVSVWCVYPSSHRF
jgi:hypothetical protein